MRPNPPAETFQHFAATLPGQLTGLALILAPAVVHPLALDGGARTAVQILAVLGGFGGTLLVFGGMGSLFLGADGTVTRPRTTWSVGLVLAVALCAGAVLCLLRDLTGDGDRYLPAAVMFVLPALALGLLLWSTRAVWSEPDVVEPDVAQAGLVEDR